MSKNYRNQVWVWGVDDVAAFCRACGNSMDHSLPEHNHAFIGVKFNEDDVTFHVEHKWGYGYLNSLGNSAFSGVDFSKLDVNDPESVKAMAVEVIEWIMKEWGAK